MCNKYHIRHITNDIVPISLLKMHSVCDVQCWCRPNWCFHCIEYRSGTIEVRRGHRHVPDSQHVTSTTSFNGPVGG